MKDKEFEPSEYDILTRIPEDMSVGKLNNVVRELRELLYQQKLKTQKYQPKEINTSTLHEGDWGINLKDKSGWSAFIVFWKPGTWTVDERYSKFTEIMWGKEVKK